jgi:hypothetical protein
MTQGNSEQVVIVLDWLKQPQLIPKIAAIEQLLRLTSKPIGTISFQPKFNQTYSELP